MSIGYARGLRLCCQVVSGNDLLEVAIAHQRDALLITEAERVDPVGRRILFVNPAFTRMTGWSSEEAIGKTPDLTVGELTDRDTMRRIVAAIDARRPIREDILKYRKDGTTLWVEIDIAPVFDEGERCQYFVSMMRDITERKLQQELLAAQTAELERTSRQRSQFLANLSHELRTPLNVIVGMSTMLLENVYGPLEDRAAHTVRRIEDNGQSMVALIDEFLDVARIESGRLPVSAKAFAVRELIDEVMGELQPMAANLAYTAAGSATLVVRTDRQKVKQIVTNLVMNALKFTSYGSVHVATAEHGERFTISVVDTGVGIAKESQARVFEQFWQVGAAVSRSHGGAGLGLFIARQLASLLGGGISLESEPGHGSTFTLDLPRELVLSTDAGE
jgi:PAS domain S-box-containing protein